MSVNTIIETEEGIVMGTLPEITEGAEVATANSLPELYKHLMTPYLFLLAPGNKFCPNEGKREEFRRYLEKTGVMDALTKVLVLLYEESEKPDDALTFIQNALAKQTGNDTIDEMKALIGELQERITQLEEANENLTKFGLPSETGEGEEGQGQEVVPGEEETLPPPPAE